ncbi:MAG TPA: NUDIX domain-containing protein [Bryobacteraceae bacterium]|jgi:predicted NUDIX family NTP pyrophosphohydrolase|nr:NUDIX domain-containing protein [Bryobacteraceae bacterium]
MAKKSAGLLFYRKIGEGLEVLLVHPGGPLWARKDDGAWSIPKGELGEGEDPLAAAQREFEEETGTCPAGEFQPLAPVKQAGGKVVYAWAVGRISTRPACGATLSGWSGRHVRGAPRSFPRWTAQRGSAWRKRGGKS